MKSVFKHEVSSHFSGLTGYVFTAFLLLFFGIFTMVYNLNNKLADISYPLADMSLVYLIAIPVLTMRVIAEERRTKTDQLLYALPLTMTQVVLGKYLALIATLFVPVVIISMYPVLLSAYGNLSLLTAFNGILGFFLLGAGLLAIGLFLSSVTDNQAVAAGICFAVMLLNYFMTSLASYVTTKPLGSYLAFAVALLIGAGVFWYMTKNRFVSLVICTITQCGLLCWYMLNEKAVGGAFPKLIGELSMFQRFYSFLSGICDLTSVVYFVSVIVFFLYLTVQVMEKRRWSE